MVDEIKNILISLNLVREKRKALDDQESTLKQMLTNYFNQSDMNSFTVKHEGKQLKATHVNNDKVEINELGLIEDLSTEQYDKIIKKSVDRKLLENAIKNGDIDENIAIKHVKVKKGNKYIKLNVEEVK